MTMTATTLDQRLTVLHHLVDGKHPRVVATIVGLSVDLVVDIANLYGPDPVDLRHALHRLAPRITDAQARCTT